MGVVEDAPGVIAGAASQTAADEPLADGTGSPTSEQETEFRGGDSAWSSDVPRMDDGGPERSYSCDEAIDHLGMGRFNTAILLMGGMAWMADAAEVMLISFIKPAVQCEWGVSDLEGALISSAVGLGMLLGAVLWGLVADRKGRRVGFLLTGLFTFAFGICTALAPSYSWLLVARFGCGIGLGGVPVVFTLTLEFLPSNQRGKWGIGFLVFWSIGGMLEAALAWRVMIAYGWRWQVGLTALPAGLMLLVFPFLPESPRWLLAQGRETDAKAVLEQLARWNRAIPLVGKLRADVADFAVLDGDHGGEVQLGSIGELLMPGVRLVTLLLWYIWFVGGGIYYGIILTQPDIIGAEHSGERCPQYGLAAEVPIVWLAEQTTTLVQTDNASDAVAAFIHCRTQLTSEDYVSTFIAASGELPGILLMVGIIDRIGRRATMGWGAIICASVCLLLIPCTSYNTETALIWVGRGVASAFFQSMFVYTSELYPSTIRTTAMGAGAAFGRLGLLLTPLCAQYLLHESLPLALSVYASFCLVCVLCLRLLPIETCGRQMPSDMAELVRSLSSTSGGGFSTDTRAHCFWRRLRWHASVDGFDLKEKTMSPRASDAGGLLRP